MRENALIVASMLTRSRDPSPLLRFPSVYSCVTRHGSALPGSARRKHRFVYCCVIAGACFDITFLAWRNTPYCSLLKAIRPEYPNRVSPFLFPYSVLCDVFDRRHLPSCCSVSSTVVTFKPLQYITLSSLFP
jgi:hypothetical protein